MMKKWWPLLAAGLGVYAIALFVTAPATLADGAVQRASQGRLKLAEARGTLWAGSGQIEVRDAAGRVGLSKRLAWRIRPGDLLRARLRYDVEVGRGSQPFPLMISWSQIELANADIDLPAEALSLGLPRLGPLELSGELNLKIGHLSIGRGAVRGDAELQWRTAGSGFSPVWPLGDYELRWDGQGRQGSTTLRTLKGPLELRGQGSWAFGRAPAFAATADAPPEIRRQIAPLLRMIAVERGEGHFELRLN
jgi:general secretion pathway protein N